MGHPDNILGAKAGYALTAGRGENKNQALLEEAGKYEESSKILKARLVKEKVILNSQFWLMTTEPPTPL